MASHKIRAILSTSRAAFQRLIFRIQEASVPRVTLPTLQIDGAGRPWWNFTIPFGWDLPFEAETSSDLRTWNTIPFETGWTPRFGGFRLPMETEISQSFFRLRVRSSEPHDPTNEHP